MLLHTATEEIGHIKMLATAVALNLDTAPLSLQESSAAASPVVNAVMGGERPKPRSASFHSCRKTAPSNIGIKHLAAGMFRLSQGAM